MKIRKIKTVKGFSSNGSDDKVWSEVIKEKQTETDVREFAKAQGIPFTDKASFKYVKEGLKAKGFLLQED